MHVAIVISRGGGRASELAGNGCWGPLYKIAPGSASPCLGGAPLLSFIFSHSRVVLYCGKPTYRLLYNPNARILILPLLSIPSNGKGILELL